MGAGVRWFGRGPAETVVEERGSSSYSDTLVDLLVSRAAGDAVAATATSAVEIAAGMVGRAFAAAEVEAPALVSEAFCPATRAMVGRALVRTGELAFAVELGLRRGMVLLPASSWDIDGSEDPESWTYRLLLAGPSTQMTRRLRAAAVVHFCWERDPGAPWRGVSPVESAAIGGRLSAELVAALADEASGTRGHLLAAPKSGDDPTLDPLKKDLADLRGRTALVESQATGGWTADARRVDARGGGWMPHRLGASPPAALVELQRIATTEILSACGVPPALHGGADGTALREGWRQFLFSTVAPLGRQVSEELERKLGVEVSLRWAELRASDITGRARAYASLVGAGMDDAEARRLAALG